MEFANHIKNENQNVIEMLKYALLENTKLRQLQETLKTLNELKINSKNIDEQPDNDYLKIDEMKETEIKIPNYSESQNLFKKINLTFKSLSLLLKILLLRIDEKKYQDAKDQKIIFPPNIDTMAIIIGTFNEAFSNDVSEMLFNILSFPAYDDLYNISNINTLLIPFVANDQINEKILKSDFDEFIILVKDFACEVLSLNTNLEPNDIVEIDTTFEETVVANNII